MSFIAHCGISDKKSMHWPGVSETCSARCPLQGLTSSCKGKGVAPKTDTLCLSYVLYRPSIITLTTY